MLSCSCVERAVVLALCREVRPLKEYALRMPDILSQSVKTYFQVSLVGCTLDNNQAAALLPSSLCAHGLLRQKLGHLRHACSLLLPAGLRHLFFSICCNLLCAFVMFFTFDISLVAPVAALATCISYLRLFRGFAWRGQAFD